MKVLGIGGSPRKEGVTNTLLDKALESVRNQGASTDKIILNDLVYKPCQACGGCDSTGVCVIKDGMGPVYAKIEKADAVIIASPVYFTGLTAQAKSMIDRFQCRWIARHRLDMTAGSSRTRKGLFICSSGQDNREHFDCAMRAVRAFFLTVGIKDMGHLYFGRMEQLPEKRLLDKMLREVSDAAARLISD